MDKGVRVSLFPKAFILIGVAAVFLVAGSFIIWGQTAQSSILSLMVETNKDTYILGENVNIAMYFVNNGGTEIQVDSLSYNLEIHGPPGFVLGMMTQQMRYINDPIVIPPFSKYLIGSYLWDQKSIETQSQVPSGTYTIDVSLLDYALAGSKAIQIG